MTNEQKNQDVRKLRVNIENVKEAHREVKKAFRDRARNEAKDYALIGIMSLAAGAGLCATKYQTLIDEINGYATLAYNKVAGVTPSAEIFDGRYDGLALAGVAAIAAIGAGALWRANRKRKEAKRLEDELKDFEMEK